jgi:hypothetical protein
MKVEEKFQEGNEEEEEEEEERFYEY